MELCSQYGIPILILCALVRGQVLPKITESYTAIGEVTSTIEEFANATFQMRFEENYDLERQRASLDVIQLGETTSFVEHFDTQQTFQYNQQGCTVLTPEDWITIGSPPDIRPYETNNGNIIFPLRQLINLTSSTLRNTPNNSTNYRNVLANLFEHRISFDFADTNTTVDVDAYWSNGDMNTSSKNSVVPLGFVVHRRTYNKTSKVTEIENQHINIFYFAHGAVDQNAFKIREGVLCTGIKPTIPFPNAENLTVFSYSAEFVYNAYTSTSTIDIWWDSKNRILRIDFDPLVQPDPTSKVQVSVSDIISHDQGAVYRISDGGDKCTVTSLNSYKFDPQNIIDVRSEGTWIRPVTNFFGLEETTMIYIGETIKRGIPCSLWQGERIDWPSAARPTTTIWEWCVANGKKRKMKYNDSWFPLVHLEITIVQTSEKIPILEEGKKLIYELYNVKSQTPGFMDALAFDLFPCFLDNHMKLMFAVNYNTSQKELNKILSNADFTAVWKAEINHAAGLSPTSLRVAKLRTELIGKNMVVKFSLLGIHRSLSKEIKKNEKSLENARKSLESAINKGKLAPEWMVSNQSKISMKAIPDSLIEEESTVTDTAESTTETINKITTQPVETESPKLTHSSIKVTDSKVTKFTSTVSIDSETPGITDLPVTGSPGSLEEKLKPKGYSPGIMALVAIIMVLVGTSIGASGTYYKIKKM